MTNAEKVIVIETAMEKLRLCRLQMIRGEYVEAENYAKEVVDRINKVFREDLPTFMDTLEGRARSIENTMPFDKWVQLNRSMR